MSEYLPTIAALLAQERSAHKWDNWFYRGIIAIIGIGAIL